MDLSSIVQPAQSQSAVRPTPQLKFAVVQFTDNSTSVVPRFWLNTEETSSKWPKDENSITKFIKRSEDPTITPDNWSSFDCTVLKKFVDYKTARAFDRKIEVTSDLDTSEPNTPHSRPIRKRRRLNLEINDLTEREEFPSFGQQHNSARDFNQILERDSSPLPPEELNLDQSADNLSEGQSNLAGDSNTATLHLVSSLDTVTKTEFQAFQRVIFTRLEEIKQDVRECKYGIESLLARREVIHEESASLPILPVSTTESLLELEDWVKESEINRDNLLGSLLRVGGNSFVQNTYNVLQKIMVNDVAKQVRYTKRSTSDKKEFGNLELRKIISDIVLRGWPQTTESQVNSKIANWFRISGDREGGRAQRTASRNRQTQNVHVPDDSEAVHSEGNSPLDA